MTNGFYKKKAMSDSRFATLYEDPSYEDEVEWAELEVPELDEIAEDLSPFNTSNS
jgi:hypothetical protein